MSDSFSFDPADESAILDLPQTSDRVRASTTALGVSATQFARAMSKAFTDAVAGGKQFDDVLKQLALRLSTMALSKAFTPLSKGLFRGLDTSFGGIFGGGGSGGGAIQAFAAGGVIAAPTYFPLAAGGLGLAGEAGPEAIVPLTRGADGRLGVRMAGAAAPTVNVQIATPDASSFRRSEAYVTGQIARAVARGQRGF
jgi:phage-related minor tail protein